MQTKILPSYAYVQYSDDSDIRAFIRSFNDYSQDFLDWFNTLELPIYTGLTGDLLEWVGAGLYGYSRPFLPSIFITEKGGYNTRGYNEFKYNAFQPKAATGYTAATDDTYIRCLTWNFYKDDGFQFNARWLKRRVARFLWGANDFQNTYNVSVHYGATGLITITVPNTPEAVLLQDVIAGGAVNLPFQYAIGVAIL
jgi:hypothetical protein